MNSIAKPAKLAAPRLPHYSVAPNVNHYQVLGVGRRASNREIDQAFLTLAAVWHPAFCRRSGGPEVFARIEEAHGVLSNPLARFEYDLTLSQPVRAPQPSHPAVAAYQRTAENAGVPASVTHYA